MFSFGLLNDENDVPVLRKPEDDLRFRPRLDTLERRDAPAVLSLPDYYSIQYGRTLSVSATTVRNGGFGNGFGFGFGRTVNRGVLANDIDDQVPPFGSNRFLTTSLISGPIVQLTGAPVTTPFAFFGDGSFTFRAPRNFNGNVTFTYQASNPTGTTGPVTTVTINAFGPIRRMAVGADQGGSPRVTVFDSTGNFNLFDFMAYDQSFTGGVRVATGDFNGDGTDDIVTAPGPGGGPNVRIFDGTNGRLLRDFMVYDPSFNGGVYITTGDIDGDGNEDIVTAAGVGGGPHVRVIAVTKDVYPVTISEFMAYEDKIPGGVRVSVGDVNGDGGQYIVTAPAFGGGPRVRAWDLSSGTATSIRDFFAGDMNNRDGVNIALGDFNSDYIDDFAVGTGAGNAVVRIYSGVSLARFDLANENPNGLTGFSSGQSSSLYADGINNPLNETPASSAQVNTLRPPSFIPSALSGNPLAPAPGVLTGYMGGARVGVTYANPDNYADLIVVTGPNDYPRFRVFSGNNNQTLQDFPVFENKFFGGVWTAGHF